MHNVKYLGQYGENPIFKLNERKNFMSIKKYVVSRDDSIYHAWPDIVKTKEGKLICVFTECIHHLDRDESRIVYCESFDKGATWSAKRALSEKGSKTLYFNCARITRLPDDSLIVLADKISKHENEKSNIYYWKADSEGKMQKERKV